ncbi:MAG: LamG domain-containing protein, partial [Clostridia bacterium]
NFDEESGARVYDRAGNFNGVLCGGSRRTNGVSGSAAKLNGSYQYVTLKSGLMNGVEAFTVSTWVYYNKNPQQSRIFDFGSSNVKYMFLTGNSANGTTRFAITTSSNGGEQIIDCGEGSIMTEGAWHHVAVTLDGNVGIVYIDGKEAGRNEEITIKPTDLGDYTRCYIGKSQWADPYLNANVDNFRVYNRALTAAEIAAIYNAMV